MTIGMLAGCAVPAAAIGLMLQLTPGVSAQAADQGRTPGAGTPQRAPASAASVESGKTLYMTHQCWACHGYSGETGTRLIQDNGAFVARLFNTSSFINFLRAPRPDDPPPARSMTAMPSYGVNSLPDQQAADLYAYIRTFTPTQPPLKDIPLLNQMISEGGKVKK